MQTALSKIKSSSGKNSKSQASIGVFDSGVGGLSVVNALQSLLPHEQIAYLADQAHFPYGEKSPEELRKLSLDAANFLLEKEVKLLTVACHTASAYALPLLKKVLPIPVIGMIEPTLELLHGKKRVALLGSKALILSNIYQERIAAEKPEVTAIPIACQELISIVEEKKIATVEAKTTAQKLLQGHHFDSILLVCTHFSFIKGILQEVAGPDVQILDPAEAVANAVSKHLQSTELLNLREEPSHYNFYSSKN